MHPAKIQTDESGRLKHFLTLEGMRRETLEALLDRAQELAEQEAQLELSQLRCANLFFEPSTRTRATFELAAKRLGGNVINLEMSRSSATKGEDLRDTVCNLGAGGCQLAVIRHPEIGACSALAAELPPGIAVLNAGDGAHAHPSQGLLDLLTIRRHKPDFGALRVVIVGDINHSRVARSLIHGLNRMYTGEVCVCAPVTLLPDDAALLGVHVYTDFNEAIRDADVVVMLRIQHERMQGLRLPNPREYHRYYGLDAQRLRRAKPDCLVMHPGPINRGVEISDDVADGPQSVILEQVRNGVFARMAVMEALYEQTLATTRSVA